MAFSNILFDFAMIWGPYFAFEAPKLEISSFLLVCFHVVCWIVFFADFLRLELFIVFQKTLSFLSFLESSGPVVLVLLRCEQTLKILFSRLWKRISSE